MRDHLAIDWAVGTRGAIENVVRGSFPSNLREWPLMHAFDFDAYYLNDEYFCIILKDKLSGIPAGPGMPHSYSWTGLPTLPPEKSDLDVWQHYLRTTFNLRPEDVCVVIPIHDSGKRAPEDFDLFSADQKYFWDQQIKFNVVQYKAYLDSLKMNSSPPMQNINNTYNVQGPNARVNVNSVDASVNSSTSSSDNIFIGLMDAASEIQNEAERNAIEAAVTEMQQSQGTESFKNTYKDFIASAANHMTLFAPFIPALVALL